MSARAKVFRALVATPGVVSDVALARYGVTTTAATSAVHVLRLMGHRIDRVTGLGWRMVLAAGAAS